MSLHVGVIGSGLWSRVHLAALVESPHVARITLAGRNEESLAQRADEFPAVAATVSDYRRLLDDPTIDVVNVVVPHDRHAEIGIEAFEAGKHVICEKPAGRTVEEFDRIAAAATRAGRRLLVVMNQLYNPVPHRVRELLEAGAIGRPFLSVENSYSSHAADYRSPAAWRTSLEQAGGGVLIDGGYHMVYRHLFQLASWGSAAWVTADAAQLGLTPQGEPVAGKGEDYVTMVVGFAAPLRIVWSHGWSLSAEPARRRQSFIAGTDGTLEFTDDRSSPLVLKQGAEESPVSVAKGPWTGTETTHACLLDYLDCLAEHRLPLHATQSLARETLAVISGGYASAERAERWPLSGP